MPKQEVVRLLEAEGIKDVEKMLEVPADAALGDIAFPCFHLAKEQKKNPQNIAAELAEKISEKLPKKSSILRIEAKSGYVNFFLNWQKVSEKILKEILKKEKYGSAKGKKIALVEFASPNPAHPIHVGSARSMFIGESLSRILEFAGYRVKRLCYINDLGKQVAVLIYGYQKFAKYQKPDKKSDHWLLDVYIKANEYIANNPDAQKEVEAILRKAEAGDKKILAVSKKLVDWCIEGFEKSFERLKIKFDEYMHESNFVGVSKKYVEQLAKSKYIFDSDEGAKIINLEKYGLPSTVIMRSDNTGLYLTRDIAGSVYKFKKYKPDLNIYVVAEDQKLHFKQQFKILELLGHEKFVKNSVHIGFGYVSLPEGKMSSRLGRVVLIDNVFDEAVKKIKEKYSAEQNKAESIGVGAVVYAILKIEPFKQVKFDWDNVLRMEGDTGPYLQYAHTRCSSILKKAGKWKPRFVAKELTEHEKNLVKQLAKWPEVVEQAAKDLRPHYICNYAFDLATVFNNFYQYCPVLKAENNVKNFRLTLVATTKQILSNGLNLIGVEPLEKM